MADETASCTKFIYPHILHISPEGDTMVTMTLAVPSELKAKMEKFPEINWSEVARQAFARRLQDMELLRKMTEHSTMTEEDALKLGADLNRKLAKRYR